MEAIKQDQNYFDMTESQRAAYHAHERKHCATNAMIDNSVIAELNRAISRREAEIMADVCGELNDDKRSVYSNDTARKAERDRRMESDHVVVAAREELEKKQRTAIEANIEATYHSDMIRILCAFAQLPRCSDGLN